MPNLCGEHNLSFQCAKFTRFKQDFLPDFQVVFDHMVDVTEPICQKNDKNLASMTIFDISGIEARVTENNPFIWINLSDKQITTWIEHHKKECARVNSSLVQ